MLFSNDDIFNRNIPSNGTSSSNIYHGNFGINRDTSTLMVSFVQKENPAP
jgi:hypothetical protein